MSPKLTGNEPNNILDRKKYVRVGSEIASQDEVDGVHIEISLKHFPKQPITNGFKPVVDDKGEIEVRNGKLEFTGRQTGTVAVKNIGYESRAETYEVARRLFGKERIG